MAAFVGTSQYITGTYPHYTTVVNTNTVWTTAVTQELLAAPLRPSGRDLAIPPQVGMWISETTPGAKPREIIDVVCGLHILCKGKRHRLIAWKNLGRYIEVRDPGTMKYFGE